jgi:hypothetical protein
MDAGGLIGVDLVEPLGQGISGLEELVGGEKSQSSYRNHTFFLPAVQAVARSQGTREAGAGDGLLSKAFWRSKRDSETQRWPDSRRRVSASSSQPAAGAVVNAQTVIDWVASKWSSRMKTAGRGSPV